MRKRGGSWEVRDRFVENDDIDLDVFGKLAEAGTEDDSGCWRGGHFARTALRGFLNLIEQRRAW